MGYTPENNPYIPGDPYSYDLKWIVDRLNQHKFAEESAAEAKASEEASAASAEASDIRALDSEAWAVGTKDGDPVAADDPQYDNNSKYWAEKAEDEADIAQDYANHIADPVSGLVTAWLADNITNPSSPPVDTSLSVAGSAADARITGFGVNYNGIAYWPWKNINKYPFNEIVNTGAGITKEIEDGCNIIHMVNSGSSRVLYIVENPTQLDPGDTLYYKIKAKSLNGTEALRIRGEYSGQNYNLKYLYPGTEWSEFAGSISITDTIDGFNLVLGTVGEVWIQHIILSTDPINYPFSLKERVLTMDQAIKEATSEGLYGKTWYALGDSITEYSNGYVKLIKDGYGVNATNGGTSGRGYMKPINGQTFVDKANLGSTYDIVTVMGSVNDMQYVASNLGTESDSGTATLGGCFNSVIDNLLASGNYHIGIIAPIPKDSIEGNPNNKTGAFAKYVDLLEKVCKRRGVPFLDLWHCSNMQPWDATFASLFMQDATHPNADGYKIFVNQIKEFIKTL